jgi:hypothetical protein
MKKYLFAFITLSVLFFAGCGHSSNEESTTNMNETKFVMLGDSLSIMVPDTITGQKDTTEQTWGATEIKIGTKFQLSIEQNEGDIALQKSDIEGNDVYKFQRYVVDEPTLLFWESKIPDMEQTTFHFYMIHKVGSTSYLMKDVESGEAYSENDVKVMIDAAKTLKNQKASKEPNS